MVLQYLKLSMFMSLTHTPCGLTVPLLGIYLTEMHTMFIKKNVYKSVHNSFIYKSQSQNLEIVQISTSSGTVK